MPGINHFAAAGFVIASSRAVNRGTRRSFAPGRLIQVALLSGLLAFFVGSLFAAQKVAVTGTVTGPSQAPIPAAKVTLTAPDGARQSAMTDASGHYSFPSIEIGTYDLSAEAAGYQPATKTGVRIQGRTPIIVDFHLGAAGPASPGQASPALPQPGYYDDTPLKASAVETTIDAAGYSSQAQSPRRLISEGPNLGGSPPRIPSRPPGSPETAKLEHDLREALQGHPNSFEAHHQLGEFYLSVGDVRRGIPYLEQAQKLKPEDEDNGYDLAFAYLEAKNPGSARSLAQGLLRRKETADIHNLLAEADEALGDPASAIKEFQLAASMDPNEKNLFDWGNELLIHNNIGPATEVFKRGIAAYPTSQRMYIGLGIADYSGNRYDEAIEALCHASDLNPSDPRPYLFLGKMYNVSPGKAGQVVREMKRFTETNPENALAYYYYALSSWKGTHGDGQQAMDPGEVEALLRKSIALDSRLAEAHLQLGVLLEDLHRDEEAVLELRAAVQFRPEDPDAHYRLAQAYVRTGDRKRGQEELDLYEKLRKTKAN